MMSRLFIMCSGAGIVSCWHGIGELQLTQMSDYRWPVDGSGFRLDHRESLRFNSKGQCVCVQRGGG